MGFFDGAFKWCFQNQFIFKMFFRYKEAKFEDKLMGWPAWPQGAVILECLLYM